MHDSQRKEQQTVPTCIYRRKTAPIGPDRRLPGSQAVTGLFVPERAAHCSKIPQTEPLPVYDAAYALWRNAADFTATEVHAQHEPPTGDIDTLLAENSSSAP